VRVKRQQQTFCFLCHPEKETIGTIKQRIYTILTQQHPMKDMDVHNLHSINDLRIVIMAQSSLLSTTTSTQEQQQQQQQQPPLVLLDSDTLEYVQQQQTELTKNTNRSNNADMDGHDPNPTTTTTTTVNENNNNNNNNNSNHGMVLYLLLPIMSKNDDANTVEEWETIQVVSTEI
jgi:hypothetical protein